MNATNWQIMERFYDKYPETWLAKPSETRRLIGTLPEEEKQTVLAAAESFWHGLDAGAILLCEAPECDTPQEYLCVGCDGALCETHYGQHECDWSTTGGIAPGAPF